VLTPTGREEPSDIKEVGRMAECGAAKVETQDGTT